MAPNPEQAKVIARTVAAVTDDLEALRFNTAISRLMEFVNAFTAMEVRPRTAMETFTLLLAPLAPHAAEELWQILGHDRTLACEPWPAHDPALLEDAEIEVPVQVNGKLRGRVVVPADADGRNSKRQPAATSESLPCSRARRSARSSSSPASWSISWSGDAKIMMWSPTHDLAIGLRSTSR